MLYPGPGSYIVDQHRKYKQGGVFGKQKRYSIADQIKKVPGPGDYNLPSMFS